MINETIKIEGRKYKVVRTIGRGGEGEVYEVLRHHDRKAFVLKRFHASDDKKSARRLIDRTRFLIDQKLASSCPLLTPPLSVIEPHGGRAWCGYLCEHRAGVPLAEHLEQPTVNLAEHLILAVTLVRMIHLLHERGISHGDLHPGNVIVERDDDVLIAALIDLDNFNAPGIAPSRAWGALQYMAPEVRAACRQRQAFPPDIGADLFALTCVLHELIFLRHIASDYLADPSRFEDAMVSGAWWQDPARGAVDVQAVGGLSNLITSVNLAQLFRWGVSIDPMARPTASQWLKALLEALNTIYLCPACGYPVMADATKHSCPACRQRYPVLALVGDRSRPVVIDRPTRIVGRGEWGSPRISARHAVLRRIGPMSSIEPKGRNPTWQWHEERGWERMEQDTDHPLEEHDRIRLADVELTVTLA